MGGRFFFSSSENKGLKILTADITDIFVNPPFFVPIILAENE
jgi:hypothetical protein